MRYTERQQECIAFLENLVYRRFSEEGLNKVLTMFFGEITNVQDVTADKSYGDTSDYNLMFDLQREDQYGYFDIYMLPLRTEDLDGNTIMITEIGYEFE